MTWVPGEKVTEHRGQSRSPIFLHTSHVASSGWPSIPWQLKPSNCHPSGMCSEKVCVPLEVYMSLWATSAHSPAFFGVKKSLGQKETFQELPWLS